PVGALAKVEADRLTLQGRVISRDGRKIVEVSCSVRPGDVQSAATAGAALACEALARGADRILRETPSAATPEAGI
ncbi:MAG: hypothetical protein RMJ35_02080, partial [Phycisphaerales bacterium]|nr:hypothetical protein [Phycisphaerales bacterium]